MTSVCGLAAQSISAHRWSGSTRVRFRSAGAVAFVALLLLLGCSGDWIPVPPPRIEGMVHKGPFLRDARVTAALFIAPGGPFDQVVATRTTSNLGRYQLELPPSAMPSPGDAMAGAPSQKVVWVHAYGAFFNEASGTIATSQISLDAMALLPTTGTQQVHVNLLTHLSYRRSVALWKGGMEPRLAIAQAEDELRRALGLAWPSGTPLLASQLSLVSEDEDARSYLWAATLQVAVAAQDAATSSATSPDARLLALIEQTESEFATQGAFSASLQAQYRVAWSRQSPEQLVAPLAARLVAVGAHVAAPNLQRSLDSDGDGYANATDTCVMFANPDQSQVPPGVCYFAVQEVRLAEQIEPVGYFGVDVLDATGHVHALALYRGQGKDLEATSDAQGTFMPFVAWNPPAGGPSDAWMALPVGDVNGDGATDLLASSTAGTVPEGLYLSSQPTGFGQFVQTTPYPYVTVAGAPFRGLVTVTGARSVAVADFDNNGLRDLAGITTDSSGVRRVVLQLQSAPGVWDPPVLPTSVPAAATQVKTVATGDLNGDGNADLVCSGGSGVQVLLGDGHAGFAALPVVQACVLTSCPMESALVDFDHDGNLDLFVVAVGVPLSWAGILNGSASGQLTPPRQILSTPMFTNSLLLRLADVNGDGWMDLVSQEGLELALYINNKTNLAFAQRFLVPTRTPISTLSLFTGRDLNSDGRAEVLLLAGLQADAGRLGVELALLRLSFK